MKSLLQTKKFFELTFDEAAWLRENHPGNYLNLQRMVREGSAKITEIVEPSAGGVR